MTHLEHVCRLINGLKPFSTEGKYTCHDCGERFKSSVEVRHHHPKCPAKVKKRGNRFTPADGKEEPRESE